MVKNDGRLVMGRGIAQQVRDSYPGIDLAFGKLIQRHFKGKLPTYHLIHAQIDFPKFAAFQVKYHWAEPANLKLVKGSCEVLHEYATFYNKDRFYLNFPAIGNGRLSRKDVLPIVDQLPKNVTLWELD